MKACITYTQDDLLNNYLFVASKSDQLRYSRRKSWLLLIIFSFVAAVGGYIAGDKLLMWYCIAVGMFFLICYPFVQRLTYRRRYRKFAADRYRSLKDVQFTLDITNENITSESSIGNAVIDTNQVELVTETADYFFIRFISQATITLPKRSFDVQQLTRQLAAIAALKQDTIHQELNWKWK